MKHILNYGLMAAMVAAVTFTSCSKDNEEDEIELSILPKKVTKIESSDSWGQTTYEFDSEGRITKTSNNILSNTIQITYQYTENSVTNGITSAKWESKNGRITSQN